MERIVRRLFNDGKLINSQHLRQAGTARGKLSIREEHDGARHRVVKVARIVSGTGEPLGPPLFDIHLTACTGGLLSLGGFERLSAGALQDECVFGQAWVLEPAADDDLIQAETEITRMARLLSESGLNPKAYPGE